MKFRTRLARGLAAVAVLASGLVAGGPAMRADAAPSQMAGAPFGGLARMYTLNSDGMGDWESRYSYAGVRQPGSADDACDASGPNPATWNGDQALYGFQPGDAVTLCVGNTSWTGFSEHSDWWEFILYMRDENGSQIGDTEWVNENLNVSEGFETGQLTIHLDDDPMDGVLGTPRSGYFEIYFEVDESGVDCPGAYCTSDGDGLGDDAEYAQGFIIASDYQYLNGTNGAPGIDDVADNESGQGAGGTNKDFSLVREFEDVWGTMNTTKLNTWVRDEDKVMVWSTKPKNYDVAWSCTQTGSQILLEACGGTSPWAQSAADESTLDAQALALNNAVVAARGLGNDVPFIGWAIHHEPHDDAILDYTKGWRSGKCGEPGDAGANPEGPGDGNKPCSGTAADYLNLYAEMREAQQSACGGECAYVKIMYIAVGSNMYWEGTGSKATSDVGEGDQLRPAAANYDILGADTYNYSCFANSLQPSNFSNGVGNGTTTFTSATAYFVSGDVGLKLEVRDVGVFTIVSRTNSTTVVLSGTVPSGTNKKFGIFRGTVCSQSKWESFEEIVDHPDPAGDNDEDGERYTVLGLARKLGKKVILAEYASHPGCNGVTYGLNEGCYGSATDDINGADGQKEFDRAAWFQQMYTWLTTDSDPIDYLLGFAYFHSEGSDLSTGDHDWRFLPVDDDGTDHAYLTHGTTGRSTWQSTVGSDANFVANSEDFSRPLEF